MSHQRRGGSGGNFTAVPTTMSPETTDDSNSKDNDSPPFREAIGPVVESYKLDEADDDVMPKSASSLSVEERYEHERHAAKLAHWKEHPYSVGLVEPTWKDEVEHSSCWAYQVEASDPSCCNYLSGLVCSRFGRVGNMVVLRQSTEWVEQVDEDEEGGEKVRRFTRPKYNCIVGPFWPMLMFVTYPLILGVSALTLFKAIPGHSILLVAPWACCTVGLIYSLALTACRDPGILPKHKSPPPQDENSWRWSDQGQSYKPRGAYYDTDCAVIVQGFDHTCPWTGTAIGGRNMGSFSFFVTLVFVCLVFDILLLTGAI